MQEKPDESFVAALIYMLVGGCIGRVLRPRFGMSKSTAHHRFLIWSRAGAWTRLHGAVLRRLDDADLIDVTCPPRHRPREGGKGGERTPPSFATRVSLVPGCPPPVGRERLAPHRRRLGGQHPRQRRAQAGARGPQTRHDLMPGLVVQAQAPADKAYGRADLRR